MNISHLRYVVEVEKTGSITQAAERLYMSQPNLSKAIRELEASLGMSIFKRSSKGVVPTKKGEEFLHSAKSLLAHVEEVRALYQTNKSGAQKISISVPRASYIAHAFTDFVNTLDMDSDIAINYYETNSDSTLHNVFEGECNLGVIRYQAASEQYYFTLLAGKGFKYEPVLSFTYMVLMSARHPLAGQEKITLSELAEYIEIAHGDLRTPFLTSGEKELEAKHDKKVIHVYERGSQFDLLRLVPHTYMWVSPMPQELLDCYGLIQKKCQAPNHDYKDLLVYRGAYRLTGLDKTFLDELYKTRDEIVANVRP